MGRSVAIPTDAIEVCYMDVSSCEEPWEWDDFKEYLQNEINDIWPSMESNTDDKWLDSEIKVLAENGLAFVTISEYGGLACIALVPRYDEDHDGLSDHWCNQIAEKFQKEFGEYIRTGTMSNGCSVYKKIK